MRVLNARLTLAIRIAGAEALAEDDAADFVSMHLRLYGQPNLTDCRRDLCIAQNGLKLLD